MSKKENQDYDIIPPFWFPIIVVGAVIAAYYIYQIFISERPYSYMQGNTGLFDIGAIVGMIGVVSSNGCSFILTKDKLVCRIFGISYREVLWTDVTRAGITRHSKVTNCIVLTLQGYAKYHPFKTIKIHESKHYITLVEKYYGILDYGYDRINPLQ